MASYTGISSNNPTKYLGPNVSLISIVTRNRQPTGADIRQGTTGKYYPIGSFWVVSKDPINGFEGELFYLAKIVANVATWVESVAGITSLTGDTGGEVPATLNNINILGTPGEVVVTGNPGTSTLTISLAGGSTAIDSFTVPGGTSPVFPDADGNIDLPSGNGFEFTGGSSEMTGNMVSPFIGDFTFQENSPASAVILTVSNTSNTADSSAVVNILSAGTSARQAIVNFGNGTNGLLAGMYAPDGSFRLSYDVGSVATNSIFIANISGDISIPVGDLSVQRSNSGGYVNLSSINNSNTANSFAQILTQVGGSSAGDPSILFSIGGGQQYIEGIDNSVSGDPWKLSAGNSLGTADLIIATTAGNITLGTNSSSSHTLNTVVATSATAGSNGDVPVQVVGYVTISINGSPQKIPYYAP